MTTEQQVQMAAQLYECRRSARILLGENYSAKMADLGLALNAIATAKGISVLSAAIEGAKGASGMQAVQILAAAVELTEPTERADRRQLARQALRTNNPSTPSTHLDLLL